MDDSHRVIYINCHTDCSTDGPSLTTNNIVHKYPSNEISTAKYNLFSFIPKFLFEQFRRYANIFFLCIGLLQQIPNVSPTGRYVTVVPLVIILALTAIKELIEDIKRHRADDDLNNRKIFVLNMEFKKWYEKRWKDIVVGDIVKVENNHFFPADLVLLSSSEPEGMCYVETSNLDGETNLKIRSSLQKTSRLDTRMKICRDFHAIIECELPNRHLYEFVGKIKIDSKDEFLPLSSSTILLRGSKLMNTSWIFGAVVYTGHESKLLMNSTQAPLKRSNIDKITNYQIIFLFLILMGVAAFSAAANSIQSLNNSDPIYLGELKENNFGFNFLTFIILYNNLIPISLQVTLEIVKFIQSYFINWDEEMFYKPSGTAAQARTSNLNEELGQIKYVFSDKTGTLTRNIMEFKKASIGGIVYSANENIWKNSEMINNFSENPLPRAYVHDFLILMSVCHTVIPELSAATDTVNYNASSPDEKALVEGAAKFGYKFISRKPQSVQIQTNTGKIEEYFILNVIEFTSLRKRMSVIVRCPDGNIKLYIKGADTVIMERLGNDESCRLISDVTKEHLKEFAQDGLRTLCCAIRIIPENIYYEWHEIWQAASTAINNREEKINQAASIIENNLTLIGATAIEDKLQDGVPETIAKLLEANIHVWILTGDKQETAVNIGYSCKLLNENMPIIFLNTSTLDETRSEINYHQKNINKKNNAIAIVIDGKTLNFALDHSLRKDFIDLCCISKSVICCRVSPIQKAEMVQLVKEHNGGISLAIGDGANDVAMIQKAHVGIGISGNEGLQAANSSDFTIAQFKYLSRLLFVHGAWNYTRISKVILYSFYKNICLYIIELWFAMYNYWSGQVLFERWTIGLYNIIFTSAPPVAMGLFNQYCNANTRMCHPSLYQSTQKSEFFNHHVFWRWIMNSIFHSILLFWLPISIYKVGVVWQSGNTGDYLVIGNIVYTYVVITVCCKAGLEMDSWNMLSHAAIWGSIVLWFLFLILYSFIWPIGIPLAANMAGIVGLIFSTAIFWLGLLLIPITTLLPDIIVKAVKTTVFTTNTDTLRIADIMNKNIDIYMTEDSNKNSRVSEASSLLQNVRKRICTSFTTNGDIKVSSESDIEMSLGYAFSQEEGGVVSQSEYIRKYDTTKSAITEDSNTQFEVKILPGVVNP